MRRALLALLIAVLVASASVASSASAQPVRPTEAPAVVDGRTSDDNPVGGIIPRPNSGERPQDAGDRGGALQLTLLGLLVVFLAVAAWRVSRSLRRSPTRHAP